MAKIKRSTAKQKKGINEPIVGNTQMLSFPRAGVMNGAKEPIIVKRPNQYKKNK